MNPAFRAIRGANFFRFESVPYLVELYVQNLVASQRSCREKKGDTDARTKGHLSYIYMGDSLEKGTKTVTRSSVAMRTPETIACFTRPLLSEMFVKLVQCDQIYESPTLNKTLGAYLSG